MKAAYLFPPNRSFPERDAPIVTLGDAFYINMRIGNIEILIDEEDARELIFKLHGAIKDHQKRKQGSGSQ